MPATRLRATEQQMAQRASVNSLSLSLNIEYININIYIYIFFLMTV